jgi:hypothetical protein
MKIAAAMAHRPGSLFGVPWALVALGCSAAAHGSCTCGDQASIAPPSGDATPPTRSGWISNLTISGRCMTVDSPQASPPNGTPVVLAPCDRTPQQIAGFDGDTIVFEGKCLDVPGWQTAPGTGLALFPCTGTTNQQYIWRPDGTLRVLDQCVSDRRAQVVVEPCNGGAEQRIDRIPLALP